jgi:type IV pilus assembly protein PilN
MTRINLLPWRETQRKQQQRDFIFLLVAGLVVAVLGMSLVHLQIDNQITRQEERNEYLRGEITRLKKAEAEIKELDKVRARLLARLDVIQHLQTSRPGMVKVFDAIPRLLPENVYLVSLKNDGNQLTMKGIANSNNAISLFMRNLAESTEFGEPVLTIVENRDINDIRASVFELAVNRKGTSQATPAAGKSAGNVKR